MATPSGEVLYCERGLNHERAVAPSRALVRIHGAAITDCSPLQWPLGAG
jgi:hypothetical protein